MSEAGFEFDRSQRLAVKLCTLVHDDPEFNAASVPDMITAITIYACVAARASGLSTDEVLELFAIVVRATAKLEVLKALDAALAGDPEAVASLLRQFERKGDS